MFRSPCVFIVGAGASVDANLPTGLQLRPKIGNLLGLQFELGGRVEAGDRVVGGVLVHYVRQRQLRNSGDYVRAGWHIKRAMPQAKSIDEFIDNHQGNEQIEFMGKLAITRAILEAERTSKLVIPQGDNRRLNFDDCHDSWYTQLWQMLITGRPLGDIDNLFQNVSFVIFNYDRCIEQYLYHSILNYYDVSEVKARELLNNVRFIHPYGMVGKLPWQHGQERKSEFGGVVDAAGFLDINGQIKTFTEQTEDVQALADLHQLIASAETIVFLGFAFHEQNMRLITPEIDRETRNVFGTVMGISDSDLRVIKAHIAELVGGMDGVLMNLSNTNCAGLFKEYSRSIAA